MFSNKYGRLQPTDMQMARKEAMIPQLSREGKKVMSGLGENKYYPEDIYSLQRQQKRDKVGRSEDSVRI